MSDLILVTGATGKTGSSLVRQLEAANIPYRAASRHSTPTFDWENDATWDAALQDVTAVYLVSPGTVNDPYSKLIAFCERAKQTGVRRFVFLSMSALPAGSAAHGLVHQWLIDNAPEWTVLGATAFIQNFSEGPYLASIRDEGQIYSNTQDGRVPFIHADDIASCALAALTVPTAYNAQFVLTSDEAISYDEVARIIGEATGRRIVHTKAATEDMVQHYMSRGIPETNARFLAFGYEWIAGGGEENVFDSVRMLTGHAPISFTEFAAANATVWQAH